MPARTETDRRSDERSRHLGHALLHQRNRKMGRCQCRPEDYRRRREEAHEAGAQGNSKWLVREGLGERIPNRLQEIQRAFRSEEHTSELQSRVDLVCRLLLEKKKKKENKNKNYNKVQICKYTTNYKEIIVAESIESN